MTAHLPALILGLGIGALLTPPISAVIAVALMERHLRVIAGED